MFYRSTLTCSVFCRDVKLCYTDRYLKLFLYGDMELYIQYRDAHAVPSTMNITLI